VELFNLNEPIDGEFSESDRLFRESKLTPLSSGFSLSKIKQMKKLASILSKKISANVKSKHDENKNANDNTCEGKDEQNDNSKRIEAKENDSLVDQNLSSGQNNTQKSSSKCNEDLNTNSDTSIEGNNIENENTFKKDNCEQDVISVSSLNNNCMEKASNFNDDEVNMPSTRKHKKDKKNSHSDKTNVSAMFEGERVSCLIGRRLGCSDEKEEVSTDDDYVLRKLFAKSSKLLYFTFKKILYTYIYIKFYLIIL